MLKTVYDFTMLFVVGAVKVSLFVFLFCFGMLFFMKSKDFAISDKPAHAGLLTNPGNTENIKNALNHEPAADVPAVPDIEDMTPEEAEVFLFVLRFSEGMSTMNARKLAKIIVEECNSHDLDPYLILAVIKVESEFSPVAVSKRGAIGLMQVMPGTGEYIAKEMGISYGGRKSLYDPFVNVKLGISYLSSLEDRYENVESALNAYNHGPTNFEKRVSANDIPTGYVNKVLSFKSYLEEESIILAKKG